MFSAVRRLMTSAQLVTIGYEGRSADEIVAELCAADVSVLIDVRLTPLSRNRTVSRQLRRQRMAEEAIRSGGPLPGDLPGRLVPLDVPYKTHLKLLGTAFDLAHERGIQGLKITTAMLVYVVDRTTSPVITPGSPSIRGFVGVDLGFLSGWCRLSRA